MDFQYHYCDCTFSAVLCGVESEVSVSQDLRLITPFFLKMEKQSPKQYQSGGKISFTSSIARRIRENNYFVIPSTPLKDDKPTETLKIQLPQSAPSHSSPHKTMHPLKKPLPSGYPRRSATRPTHSRPSLASILGERTEAKQRFSAI